MKDQENKGQISRKCNMEKNLENATKKHWLIF